MYTYICVPQLGLLNDCVESGNQADEMVADDHNPRRKIDYGNLNLPVNHDLCIGLTLRLTIITYVNYTPGDMQTNLLKRNVPIKIIGVSLLCEYAN